MFQDLGALLHYLGTTDPKQADVLAAHMDSQGIPPPEALVASMKLGRPKPGEPLKGAGPETGPTTDIGALISGTLDKAVNGPEENSQPSLSPHAIPNSQPAAPTVDSAYSSSPPQAAKMFPSTTFQGSAPNPAFDTTVQPTEPQPMGVGGPDPAEAEAAYWQQKVNEALGNPNPPIPQQQGSPLQSAIGQAGMKLAAPTPMPGPITGVTGGVKAPDHPNINPAVMQGIVQLLMHPHATAQGPSLGSLIR